ncbi:MFS transporter [Streptomyces termitum]|uniref:MFS transporter n=1 Tax=Streptomyces termitum TaxID=67368 RepID=UPI0037BDAEED
MPHLPLLPPPGTDTAPARPKGRGPLLLGLSLGYFMVLLDTTVVTVALPAIGADLSGSRGGLQWVSNGYTLAFAALLLTAGALSDRYGDRRVFLTGLWLFAVLSALSAAAGSTGVLIALRVLLGAAGALLLPASLAIVARVHTDPAARARAMGAWAAITGTALAAGPLAGGVLTDAFGWRSVFLLNVPVALVGLVLTTRYAPSGPPGPAKGLDPLGQCTAALALTGLAYALVESGPAGWWSPRVLAGGAVFAVAGALFVYAERRPESEAYAPMLPLSLFRARTLSAGLVAGLLANFGLSGVLFVLSLSFQQERGHTAFATGLAFLPLTLPTAFNPVLTGRLVARVGARGPALAGFLMMGAGTLVPAVTTSPVPTGAGLALLGFGVSFALPPLMTAVLGAAPAHRTGTASGALNASRQTGATLGVAVLGALPTPTALLTAALALLTAAAVAAAFLESPARGRKHL